MSEVQEAIRDNLQKIDIQHLSSRFTSLVASAYLSKNNLENGLLFDAREKKNAAASENVAEVVYSVFNVRISVWLTLRKEWNESAYYGS